MSSPWRGRQCGSTFSWRQSPPWEAEVVDAGPVVANVVLELETGAGLLLTVCSSGQADKVAHRTAVQHQGRGPVGKRKNQLKIKTKPNQTKTHKGGDVRQQVVDNRWSCGEATTGDREETGRLVNDHFVQPPLEPPQVLLGSRALVESSSSSSGFCQTESVWKKRQNKNKTL